MAKKGSKKTKKTVKKKEAARKAATKRSSTTEKAKEKKKKTTKTAKTIRAKTGRTKTAKTKTPAGQAPVTKKSKAKAGKQGAPSVADMESLEEPKDTFAEVSKFLFQEHPNATMMVGTVICCLLAIFLWKTGAERKWRSHSWVEVNTKLASSDFSAQSGEKKITQLKKMFEKYKHTPVEILLLNKIANLYYKQGKDIKAKNSTDRFKLLKESLENSYDFYEKVAKSPFASGFKLVAKKNMSHIQKEIEIIKNPPAFQKLGHFQKAENVH